MRYTKSLYLLLFALFTSFSLTWNVAVANDVYKVSHVGQGNSLKLHAYPARHSRVVVAIPHNASWVVKREKRAQRKVAGELWHKVRWNSHEGWVQDKYLSKDILSTRKAKEHLNVRQQCLANNAIKDKSCCGYVKAKSSAIIKRIDMYAVKGVAKGSSVPLRSTPGKWKGSVLVAVPHSAKWIVALPNAKVMPNGNTWQKVRWGSKTGWINKKYIQFDNSATLQGEKRRKQCSR
jgi:hypothetical protein